MKQLIFIALAVFLSCSNPTTDSGGSGSSTFTSTLTPLWAKSADVSGGSQPVALLDSTIDSSGNVYTACLPLNNFAIDFGNGISFTPPFAAKDNPLIVKYDKNGLAQSTITCDSGSGGAFRSIEYDKTNNLIWAIGLVDAGSLVFQKDSGGTKSFTKLGSSDNHFIAAFSPVSGKLVSSYGPFSGTNISNLTFAQFKLDSSSNLYVSGYMQKSSTGASVDFDGVNLLPKGNSDAFILKLHYNNVDKTVSTVAGNVLTSATDSSASSWFWGLGVSSSKVYVCGTINGTETAAYTTSSGSVSFTHPNPSSASSGFVIAFDTSLTGLWKFTLAETAGNLFYGITTDSNGNAIVGGGLSGTSIYNFGGGKTLQGTSTGTYGFLASINQSGVVNWVNKIATNASSGGVGFTSLVFQGGLIYGLGSASGTGVGTVDFGNSITKDLGSSGSYVPFVATYGASDGAVKAVWAQPSPSLSLDNTSVLYWSLSATSSSIVVSTSFTAGATHQLGSGVSISSTNGSMGSPFLLSLTP